MCLPSPSPLPSSPTHPPILWSLSLLPFWFWPDQTNFELFKDLRGASKPTLLCRKHWREKSKQRLINDRIRSSGNFFHFSERLLLLLESYHCSFLPRHRKCIRIGQQRKRGSKLGSEWGYSRILVSLPAQNMLMKKRLSQEKVPLPASVSTLTHTVDVNRVEE